MVAVTAAVGLLAAGGITAGVLATNGSPAPPLPPKAVIGQSLKPLKVYQRVLDATRAGPGERSVPALHSSAVHMIIKRTPLIELQVEYAHLRPISGYWQLSLLAPSGPSFTLSTAGALFPTVIIDGKGADLSFASGTPDGTNFGIWGRAWQSPDVPEAFARTLTTSVTVAHCTQEEIQANMCA